MKDEKVILVEDCRFQGRITADVLQKSGYETMWVRTAEEAIENELYKNFDVVILDVILPGMDGYECCKIIRKNTKVMPIVMLTSMEDEKSVIKALNSGADDYIKKPHSNQEFIARIEVQLRSARLQKELIKKNMELEEANKIIKQLAITDVLTGANNRSFLPELLDNISKNISEDNIKIATLMIDIDNFKSVNDTYGHLIGDTVLKEIGELCINAVGEDGVVIRFGGEEFLVVITNSEEEISTIGEKVRLSCEESYPCGFKVTVSIGGCAANILAKDIRNDFEKCLKISDSMLYVSKKEGKNKVTIFNK